MVTAAVLSAGFGTRLRPLQLGVPKPMAPLGGRPLLEYTLGLLRHHGFSQVAMNLLDRPAVITDFFGDVSWRGMRLHYLYESSLSGTAGAVRQMVGALEDGPIVVIYGDVLTDLDLTALLRRHRRTRVAATIVVHPLDDPRRRGVVHLGDGGAVVALEEKPAVARSPWANAGIYVLERRIVEMIGSGEQDFARDVFPDLISARQPIGSYVADSYLLDIGEPAAYRQAELDIREGRCTTYVDW